MGEQVTLSSPTMPEEVIEGLRKDQKSLPSKYFYDQRGEQYLAKVVQNLNRE